MTDCEKCNKARSAIKDVAAQLGFIFGIVTAVLLSLGIVALAVKAIEVVNG